MASQEIFYLHIDGAQRGPYTVPQIDHLLNSGLIAEETLYWREGLEQWAPVTSLVVKRERERSWKRLIIALPVVAAVGLLGAFFGPVVVNGWREANQHQYTAQAAYWRAREVVRSQALPRGTPVKFAKPGETTVELRQPFGAVVALRGEVVDAAGQARTQTFQVELRFDERRAEWSGFPTAKVAQQ